MHGQPMSQTPLTHGRSPSAIWNNSSFLRRVDESGEGVGWTGWVEEWEGGGGQKVCHRHQGYQKDRKLIHNMNIFVRGFWYFVWKIFFYIIPIFVMEAFVYIQYSYWYWYQHCFYMLDMFCESYIFIRSPNIFEMKCMILSTLNQSCRKSRYG